MTLQGLQRRLGEIVFDEVLLRLPRVLDFRLPVAAAPDDVRIQPYDRIAAARFAALHAFEQKGVLLFLTELEKDGNGRFEVGHQPHEDRLRPALFVFGRERRKAWRYIHELTARGALRR